MNTSIEMRTGNVEKAGRRLDIRYSAVTTVSQFLAADNLPLFYSKLLDEVVRRCVTETLHEQFSLLSVSGSHASISRSMFEPQCGLVDLQTIVTIVHSGRKATLRQTRGKRSTLALPKVIDLQGYTATIRRTLAIDFYELSTSLDVGWQPMPSEAFWNANPPRGLKAPWVIPGVGIIPSGSQE